MNAPDRYVDLISFTPQITQEKSRSPQQSWWSKTLQTMLYQGMLSAVARIHRTVARAIAPLRSSLHRSHRAENECDRTHRAISWRFTTLATASTTAQLPAITATACETRQDGFIQPSATQESNYRDCGSAQHQQWTPRQPEKPQLCVAQS